MNNLSNTLLDSSGYTLIGGGQQQIVPPPQGQSKGQGHNKTQGQMEDYNISAIETEDEDDNEEGKKEEKGEKDEEEVVKSPKPRDSGCYMSLGEISPTSPK